MTCGWILLAFTSLISCRAEVAADSFLEGCCCSKDYVESNFAAVRDALNVLVQQPYFRFFKANLERPCPYWAVNIMCSAAPGAVNAPPPCHVCVCDENEVPMAVKEETTCLIDSVLRESPWGNSTIMLEVDRTTLPSLRPWTDASQWFFHEYNDPGMVYVDLVRNPESNTGYVGQEAQRIWRAIYLENCFHAGAVPQMCLEERVFYRLVSGLHASVSTHIAAHFAPASPSDVAHPDDPEGFRPTHFLPNWEQLEARVAAFPDRVDNLYYVFMFVLRAVIKLRPLLLGMHRFTGDSVSDAVTRAALQRLYATPLACTPTFNESLLFQSSASNSALLVSQMRANLQNITRLMDCLTCEKCRLWGKLQTLGLATALKVVIDKPVDPGSPAVLTRSELVALVNFLRQLSISLHSVNTYFALKRSGELPPARPSSPASFPGFP